MFNSSKPAGHISAKLLAEKWYPFAIGGLSCLIVVYFMGAITEKLRVDAWNLSNLYGSVFNWAALQTGFLFSVYGFVVAKQGGFIDKIRKTTFMDHFVSYTKRAIIIGFVLTFSSIPLIVINFSFKNGGVGHFVVVDLWFGLFIWAFLSFVRVAYIFGIIARVRDNDEIPG
jgi:hypothetical protein